MEEISNLVYLAMEDAAREERVDIDAWLDGLPVDREALHAPRGRFDWDVLIELCVRLERSVGADGLVALGRRMVTTRLVAPISRLGAVVSTPVVAFAVRWLAPGYYRHATFDAKLLGESRTALEIRVRPGYADAPPSWFRIGVGVLEALPIVVGRPPAQVELELSPRHGRYMVTSAEPRLRDRLRSVVSGFAPRAALDELVRQRAELDAAQRAHEQAVREARQHEQFARAVIDRVDEIVVVIEADSRIRFISSAVERLLGYAPTELRGRSVGELLDPSDGPIVAPNMDKLMSVPGFTVRDTLRMRAKDGGIRILDASGINLTHDPAIHGILLHGRDVTARLAAEKALREQERALAALLANIQGMAYRRKNDDDWTMELVSPGAQAVTGYDAAELVGDGAVAFGDLIHPDDVIPLRDKWKACLEARKPFTHEYRIRSKGGQWHWVVDVAAGVFADEGLVAIEGFLTNVTDRHNLEEKLAHSQRLEGIGRLAGGIAHDFNNLLAAMLAYSELALGSLPADSSAVADVREIRGAALRAADLTRQLLAFARRQVVQPRAIDLNELVVGIDRLLRRILGEDVDLQTLPAENLWLVEADPGQIEQVLMNLAVNAREAMPNGGQLTIETANVHLDDRHSAGVDGLAAGDYVRLAVTDTGEGMSPDAQRHAFDPFYTTKPGGSGLGLATCHGIVAQAGGGIFLYSEPGNGTSFKVYLPRSKRTTVDTPPAEVEPVRGAGEIVLLVEDHAQLRASMARSLESAGYRVLPASGGADALAMLERHGGPIDLLLTDVVMPGMGGHALALAVRERQPGLRVLFVSGYTENSVIRQGVPGAGIQFLPKPFTLAQLTTKVGEVLASEPSTL